jgi:PKD repeat protein
MPDGMNSSVPDNESEVSSGAPLDGVRPLGAGEHMPVQKRADFVSPSASEPAVRQNGFGGEPQTSSSSDNKKKLLIIVLAGGGSFLLFYLFFAFYLMASLPAADGGGQGLRLIGNVLYAAVSVVTLCLFVMIALRYLRAGMEPAELIRPLMRPGILVLFVVLIAIIVFVTINRQVPLTVDIIAPANVQSLTAPTSVTFGTDALRAILRKQNLRPKRYKWDFDGNETTDAETIEDEVTTVYKRKGTYRIIVTMQLSDNSVRKASTLLTIPSAVFDVTPSLPLLDEEVLFDASNLVTDPKSIEIILWDFNGDGETDEKSSALGSTHMFTEVGTYQAEAKIQYQGGLQETYVRPVIVEAERKQPFQISIQTEGDLQGSAPLGILFQVVVEEGVSVASTQWTILGQKGGKDGIVLQGKRVSHVFAKEGEYRIAATVKDVRGRTAEKNLKVVVLEPLRLTDVIISGTPKPSGTAVEGIAPLEVKLKATTQTPFITFKWEQENASEVFSFENEYHAIYNEEGLFPIVLVAKDARERTQKFPLEIKVLPPRSRVEFSAVPSTGIAPLTVTFDASQSYVPDGRITGFSWLFGDGGREEQPQLLGAKVTHRYEKNGEFKVVVRALTEDGRSFEASCLRFSKSYERHGTTGYPVRCQLLHRSYRYLQLGFWRWSNK